MSGKEEIQKREERFSLVGEDDGQGCIVLHKHYLYNPKRKSKPIKIPVKDFWGTAESFIGGAYKAQYLPEDKRTDPKESLKKLKLLQKNLRAANLQLKKDSKKLAAKKVSKKSVTKKTTTKKTSKKI